MESRNELSKYRLEEAYRCLQAANALVAVNDYKSAANRSYYCVFNAMKSILALEAVDFKHHSAVISHFRKNYVKTGIFDTKMSDIPGELFTVRGKSDYMDFYVISKEQVSEQIESAEYFLGQIHKYHDEQRK